MCISSTNFELIATLSLQSSANSITQGIQPDTLIVGQNNGFLTVIKIDGEVS